MARPKKTEAKTTKRVRRSPEILLKELDKKRKKLEECIYKSNKELVHHIGVAILKRAKFDLTALTADDLNEIANGTPKGSAIIQEIVAQAHQN